MSNNLRKLEKQLRSYAKRVKGISYTSGLLIAFLLTGVLSLSNATLDKEISKSKAEIKDTTTEINELFKKVKKENEKLLKNKSIELIQLMEQGDQVVKSPWSSWQFGVNTFIGGNKGRYSGKGDKDEKYPYEGIFVRDNWDVATLSETTKEYEELKKESNKLLASTSSRNNIGETKYGMIDRKILSEQPFEIKLQANVTPREVTFTPINIEPKNTNLSTKLEIPEIEVPTFSPQEPSIETPIITEAPILVFRPTGFGQQWHPAYFPDPKYSSLFGYRNILVQNFASYDTEGLLEINDTEGFRGTFKFKDINETNYQIEKDPNYPFQNAFISDTHDGDVEINGNYKLNFSDIYSSKYFVSLNPYEVRKRREFKFLGNLEINSQITNSTGAAIAFEHQLLSYGPGGHSYGSSGNNGGATDDPHQPDAQSVLINEGNIKLASGRNMVGIVIDTEGTQFLKHAETINRGKIEIGENASESLGIDFGSYEDNAPYDKIYLGNIVVNGRKSYAFRLQPQNNLRYYEKAQVYGGDDLGNKSKIEVYGEENVGVSISQNMNNDPTDNTKNAIEEIHGLNILVGGNKNVGFLRRYDYVSSQNNNLILNDTTLDKISFADTSNQGVLVRTDKYKITSEKAIETKTKGDNNIVYLANGKESEIYNKGNITINKSENIDNGKIKTVALFSMNGAKVTGDSTIIKNEELTSIGIGAISMNTASDISEAELKTSKIEMTGEKSVAVYNENSKVNVENSEITVNGKNTIAFYHKSSIPLTIKDTKVNISGNAIGFYPTKYGTNLDASGKYSDKSEISLENSTAVVSNGGLYFYSYTNEIGHEKELLGKLKLTTNNKMILSNEGVAFYNRGNINNIPSYLDFIEGVGGLKELNIELKEGARVFVLDDPSTVFNLSSLPSGTGTSTLTNASGTARINITVEPGINYKYYTANGGTLNIDTDVNLDRSDDNYFKNDIMSVSVNVINPITNNGENIANGTKYAIAEKNSDPANISKVKVKVDNTITLTNKEGLTGVVVDAGQIENNSIITVTGDKGIGVLGTNKTEIVNNKDILIGNKGIGIFGLNKLTSSSNSEGFKIKHNANSVIEYKGENDRSYGIVALNNTNGTILESTNHLASVELGDNSKIDLSNSEEGIGVLLKGTNITFKDDGAKINIGRKGKGIFIDDLGTNTFNITLNKGNINVIGDEGIGIYSNDDLMSRKVINVSGKKSTGYYSKGNLEILGKINVADSTNNESERTLGVYAEKDVTVDSEIEVGKNSIGIYKKENTLSTDSIRLNSNSKLKIKDADINENNGGVGVYAEKSNIILDANSEIKVGDNKVKGIYGAKGSVITNNSTKFEIGEDSFGFVIDSNSVYNGTNEKIELNKDKSLFIYGKDSVVNIGNDIRGTGNEVIGIYGVNSNITSNKNIDLSSGKGNVGIYGDKGIINFNSGNIIIGESIIKNENTDNEKISNAVGIVGKNGAIVNVSNGGEIRIKGDQSVGLFGTGTGTKIENRKNIVFEPDTSKVTKRMIGIFGTEGAEIINYGNISTANNYIGNSNVKGIVGIGVVNSKLENHGNIAIEADESTGVVLVNSLIKNYGTITIKGNKSTGVVYNGASKGKNDTILTKANRENEINVAGGSVVAANGAKEYDISSGNPNKALGGVKIEKDVNENLKVKREGVNQLIDPEIVNLQGNADIVGVSNLSLYVDTLGKTSPPVIEGAIGRTGENNLVIGLEASNITNSRDIKLSNDMINKFMNNTFIKNSSKLNINTSSLTWISTYNELNNAGEKELVLSKIPYTSYALNKNDNVYNFLDGLEQRYDKNALDSREKKIFNKLNGIGKNEGILLSQAFDEMMGHQYANTQMRIKNSGDQLNKEFEYLMKDWYNPSKQNNKLKVFGMKSDFNTDTAGIKDFESNSYGVAYVHEDETIKLGQSSGWYAGLIYNRFRFKDIGKSVEDQNMLKLGMFKTRTYDNNGSLKWKVSVDGFVGMNDMERKYLVVDEIFGAKSRYYTYGIGVRNEVSKDYRLSEHVSLVPYGSLNVEYGRFTAIKEQKGEVRLEVKGNHYLSVKPEVGAELKYSKKINSEFKYILSAGLAYELELGKVYEGNNKARVNYTNADWYNLAREKENRTGNLKGDLKFGLEKNRFGLTLNVGYDTKGHNVRGGIGVRAVY